MAQAPRGREWRLHANLDAVPPRVDDDARRGRAEEGVVHPRPLISMLRDDDLCNAARRQHSLGSFGARTRVNSRNGARTELATRAGSSVTCARRAWPRRMKRHLAMGANCMAKMGSNGHKERHMPRVTGLWWGG